MQTYEEIVEAGKKMTTEEIHQNNLGFMRTGLRDYLINGQILRCCDSIKGSLEVGAESMDPETVSDYKIIEQELRASLE